MILKKWLLGVAVLMLLAFSAQTFAQGTGSVKGTVKDPSNAMIPDAAVTVKNTETGVEVNTKTNNTGTYSVPGLLPGNYDITVAKEGFVTSSSKDIRIGVGDNKVDVKLAAGKKTDVVEVNIKAENIILDNGPSVGVVLPEDQIAKLPLVNSNVLDLVKVMGGVIMTDSPIFGADATTLQGLSAANVNVQKDGVTANNVRWQTGMNTPMNLNPEMVSEFKVIVSPVDAEMGRGSGQIQVVTRSGGNAYRGSVVWNIQNSKFNAGDWTANKNRTTPTWRNQNEWIAQGSGPIIKNKTFVFGLYDYTRSMSKENVNPLLPTACARKGIYRYFDGYGNGNFVQLDPTITTASKRGDTTYGFDMSSYVLTNEVMYKKRSVEADGRPRTDLIQPLYMGADAGKPAKLEAFNVFGAALPANWNAASDINCDQIANITTDLVYPKYGATNAGSKYDKYRQVDTTGYAQRFISGTPLPNSYLVGDGLNFGGYSWTRRNMGIDNVYGIGETPNRKQINIRVDHSFSSRNRASVSYTYEVNHGDDAMKTMPLPYSYGGQINRKPQTLSVSLTSTLKPSLLNELRVGYMRAFSYVNGPMSNPETGADLRAKMLQLFPTADWANLKDAKVEVPVLMSIAPFQLGSASAYNPYGSGRGNQGLDWGSTDPRFTFADTITWQFGRHSIRIGGEHQRTKSDLHESGNRNIFVFAGTLPSVYPTVNGGNTSAAKITGFDPATGCPDPVYPVLWAGAYCFKPDYSAWIAAGTTYSFPGQIGSSAATNITTGNDYSNTYKPVSSLNAQTLLNFFSGSVGSLSQYFFINSPTQTRYNNIKDGELFKQTVFYQRQINWFAQDNWRVTDDLTLQLGMRWEWYGVPFLGNGMTSGLLGGGLSAFGPSGRGFNNWLTQKWDPFSGQAKETAYNNCVNAAGQKVACDLATLTFVGPDSPHPESNFYNDDYNNFGPVAGFAYTLPWGGKGKTVIRGGIQISYLQFGRADTAISNMPNLSRDYSWTPDTLTYMTLADVKNYIPLQLPSYMQPPTNSSNTATPIDQRNTSLTVYDPNIRTPYTQSLNMQITRTIGSNLTVDVRYSGNLSRKSASTVNLNTPNMISTGLFQAFKDARAGKESALLDRLFNGVNILGACATATSPVQPICNAGTASGAKQLRTSSTTKAWLANGSFTSIVNWLATANITSNYNYTIVGGVNTPKFANLSSATQRGQILREQGFPENWLFASPQFSSVTWNGNMNGSNYHSMQTQVTLRPTHGLMLSATYTLSKSMGYNGISDFTNRDVDYGYTGGRNHQFTSYGTFDLPFGPNRWLLSSVSPNILGRIIGGWQMSWIYTMYSGARQTLTGDVNYLWGGNMVNQLKPFDFAQGYVTWKPGAPSGNYFGSKYTLVADPQCSNSALLTTVDGLNTNCTLKSMVDKTALGDYIFINAKPGERGNLDRFTLNSPIQWNMDGAFSKSVRLTEGKSIQVRVDATNVFNHPQPGAYTLAMSGTNDIGAITAKSGNRKFQARLRLDF